MGLLVVLPVGVIIAGPSGSTAPAPAPVEWTAQHDPTGTDAHSEDASQVLSPEEVLEAMAKASNGTPSGGGASAIPVAARTEAVEAPGEVEGEATTPLPVSYVAGTPPAADLAAVLRQSEKRNTPQAAPPTGSAGAQALVRSPNIRFTRQSQVIDLTSGQVDPRIVDLLSWIVSRHQITITSMRTDHSMYVAGTGRVSAHKLGRAVDIAVVDGQSCNGVPSSPCARLYEEIVNQLRGTQYQPSQVIHGYDPWPSESWNFAMGNHNDHIHVGY